MKWINVQNQLPECDGRYQVTNYCDDDHPIDLGILEYDGYGFKQNGIYYHPKFWRKTEPMIKRYGNIE